MCLHNWGEKQQHERLWRLLPAPKSKFIPDPSFQRYASGIAIKKIYNFNQIDFPD